ncbi:oxidoreductase [Actinophytocola xinjiangensis]|uniref:Oxidoreductase n=1 Tax=Actinophytocola xinjiangensis TaxID=485602 RepID=A0A7Z1B186_9PSEU|nr:Gfo/Idh/MocA family oxidoreductase [Actinophytocola xinjiangensis]OLF13130.1 oxidoreductase [Actinophytocola xinjiangensis]
MRPLRLGLIGLGVISRFYLSAIQGKSSVRLTSVCDQDEAALSPHRGNVACYRDHRSMLAGTALDAVIVAVPNDAHLVVCHDALATGLPVCVEKPLALTVEQGEHLVRFAAERQLPLLCAFHRRYNDNVTALVRELAGRPIESVRIRYLERIEEHTGDDRWYLEPERCGGGCVADNGPNAFDLAHLLLGPVTATAAEIARDDKGVDRQASIRLRSVDGVPVSVELDWSYPGEVKEVEVRLADGTVLRADMLAGHERFKASLWHEYAGVLDDFVAAVTGRGTAPRNGLPELSLVDACYRMSDTEVPLDA